MSQSLAERVIPERIIYLSGEVNEHSIAQVIAGIVILANQDAYAPITLLVSTYGGSVDEMFSLYDVIKHVSCPIHTVGLGKIMSAGVLILASGKKGCRTIGQSARVMIHSITAGSEGTPFQLKNDLRETERQQKLMEDMLLRETKLTRAKLSQIMKSGFDSYLSAQEALKLGIVDAIIEPKENK
jgi:ATP-dependent Clp protease, protease subunit